MELYAHLSLLTNQIVIMTEEKFAELEVYVNTLKVCEKRDPKGLYKLAKEGKKRVYGYLTLMKNPITRKL